MITPCRLIYPYYNNPRMLQLQVENWSRFEGELRDAIRIIVIDDHSKVSPVPILEQCKAPIHCYRLASDLSLIHISEPTRLLSISYAVFCLKKKNKKRSRMR